MPDPAHIAKQSITPSRRDPAVAGEQVRRTRRAIAEAAAHVFTRDGYGDTTVETVAALAGVSPRTVHRHFGTKSALLAAGVAVRVADFLHRLDDLIANGEPIGLAWATALNDGLLDSTSDTRSLINVAHGEREVWGLWLEAFHRHQERLAITLATAAGRPEEAGNLDWVLRAGMVLNALCSTYLAWAQAPDGDLDAMMKIAADTTLSVILVPANPVGP